MGRPINKSKIGYGAGRIAVSRHYFTGGSEATTAAHIYKVKGANQFWVRLDSDNADPTAGEVLKLTTEGNGSMPEGTFRIDATGSDSTVYQVTQLRNRTVQIENTAKGTATPPDGDKADNVIYEIGNHPDAREDSGVPNAVLSVSLPRQS